MHSPRDRRMTKPVARRPLRPTGYDGMGPAARDARCKSIDVFDGNHRRRRAALHLAPWRSQRDPTDHGLLDD